MTDDGKRVLIVEDDYFIALYLASEVAEAGGKVAGVARNVDAALDIIANEEVDGAIVDVNLMGEWTFRVADALTARQIPFAFATAISRDDVPPRYATVPWLQKPFLLGAVSRFLDGMTHPAQKDRC
jgi:DNA-binding response OmpR family regulator